MEILITIGFIYLYYYSTLQAALTFVGVGSLCSVIYGYFYNKEKIIQYLAFFLMVVIFGSFTLIFDDPKIYMLKTSFSFIVLAGFLFCWPIFMKKTLFDEIITTKTCSDKTLRTINLLSIFMCLCISATNAYIVQNYDMVTWGKFKIILGFLTAIYTTVCLAVLSSPWKKQAGED